MPVEHRMNESEAQALYARFGGDPAIAGQEAPTVQDIAEATGAPKEDVQAYLDRLRTERAFDAPRRFPIHPLWIIGGVALAVGYVGIRVRASNLMQRTGYDPLGISRPGVAVPARSLGQQSWTIYPVDEQDWPPVGLQINVASQHALAEAQRFPRETEPLLPTVMESERMLARSLIATVEKARSSEGMESLDKEPITSLPNGVRFSYRPGYVFYSIFGWAGTKTGYLRLDRPIEAEAEAIAHQVIRDGLAREAQAKGQADSAVLPPPGFSVLFAGRRFATTEGPRARFRIAPNVVREGLRQAILDAVARDRKPPTGRWDRPAAFEAKVPAPPVSRVVVFGPRGPYRFDVPTASGPSGADGAIRRALAKLPIPGEGPDANG